MNTLEEVEVKNGVLRNKKISEMLHCKNLWYPCTVKKILTGAYFKNYLFKISDEDLDYLVNSLEHFCHCLFEIPEVNSYNISNIAMFVIAENEEIREEIYSCHKENNTNFKDKRNILHLKIKQAIKKINFKEINLDLDERFLFIDPSKESKDDIGLVSNEELEYIILSLIEKNNFSYSDILTKFFLELDLNYIFKFRKDYTTRNLIKSKRNLMVLLNNLNNMLYEVHKLFVRDGLFLYRMLQTSLFTEDELKNYFKKSLTIKNINFNNDFCEQISIENKYIIIRGFINGLSSIKNCYYIQFGDYNNCNMGDFKYLPDEIKCVYLKDFCSKLENSSIYTLYCAKEYSKDEITKHIDNLDSLVNDIYDKQKMILVIKQELSQEQKSLVLSIMSKLENDKVYSEICLSNLNRVEKQAEILSFNISLNEIKCFVQLSKNNSDLYWNLYYKKKKILREICVCEEDINRLKLFFQKYIKNEELMKKYSLG